jgi:pimeloyl-ACP methyl ester carboxylesterase
MTSEPTTARIEAPVPMRLRSRRLYAAGRTTSLIESGDGPLRLVWLPALLDSAAGFTRVALPLSRTLRDIASVCAVDPPGYGASSDEACGGGIPTFAELAPWIDAVLDQIPGPFILVGNSSGAVIAAAAAHRHDVRGLALVGWCDWRLVGVPHRELLCPSDARDLERLIESGWHTPPRMLPSSFAAQLAQARRADYRKHVASFDPLDFGAKLDRYRGPLALIAGGSDGIITPPMVRALARSRPGAELFWIDECGHYPHREQPDRLADALSIWITRLVERDHAHRGSTHGPTEVGGGHP